MLLLETLTDPDDGVRTVAVRLVDQWIETFNHNQTQPTPMQLQRIGALLDSVASRMPEKTAKMLRFSLKPSHPTMESIRVGFFEDFKGADTVLLDVDRKGLKDLIEWLQTATSSGRGMAISQCHGAVVQSGLHIDLSCAPKGQRPREDRKNCIRLAAVRGGLGRSPRQVGCHGQRRLPSISRGSSRRRRDGHGKHWRVRRSLVAPPWRLTRCLLYTPSESAEKKMVSLNFASWNQMGLG